MRQEWLLVYDNARDPGTVEKYVPANNRGNILITSRNPVMHGLVNPRDSTEVDQMGEEEAITLLLRASHCNDTTGELRQIACSIVVTLCYLPLAIDQAGASIASGLCDLGDYLEQYERHHQELLDNPSFSGASNYGQAVYGTWELSVSEIEARAHGRSKRGEAQAASRGALLLLQIFACLHHENIPEMMFRSAAKEIALGRSQKNNSRSSWEQLLKDSGDWSNILHVDHAGNWDNFIFRKAVEMLISFSLVKCSSSGRLYSMHPLVHLWCQDRCSKEEKKSKYVSADTLVCHSITYGNDGSDYAFNIRLSLMLSQLNVRSMMMILM